MGNNLTQSRLKQVLHYDPATGVWTWLAKTGPASNRIVIGAVAGSFNGGYIAIQIDGFSYKAHRLAFLYMLGRWPNPEADHEDLDRSNNQWNNLREATRSQNLANRRVRSNSASGLKGIKWYKRSRKWQSLITINRRRKYLGLFDCPAAAHFSYIVAADKAFGEFARVA